ncbi:MAG: ATP-dependent DNA ligase [Propioniciclava sp.]
MSLPLALPIAPMLARSVAEIPRGAYAYEPKWDGFRCIAARDGDTVTLWSRSQNPLTPYFPEVVAALARTLPTQIILDGELVVRSGEPGAEHLDWETLSLRLHPAERRIARLATRHPATLIAFDLLALGDVDLTPLPFKTRREALVDVVPTSGGGTLHRSRTTHDPDVADTWFATFEGAGLDGVVAKEMDAPYRPGARAMLKIKHSRTADTVVIGYSRSRTGHGVGSIHLGLYDELGALIPVGGIGAWPDAVRSQLEGVLAPLVLTGADADTAPSPSEVSRAGIRDFVPVQPDLVVEVAYDQMQGTHFRSAVGFQRWRPDRDPRSCGLDQIERPVAYDLGTVWQDG